MKLKVKNEQKKLICLFDGLTGKRSMWQLFNDCVCMIAIAIQNSFMYGFNRGNALEKEYKNIAAGYTKAELMKISEIFAELVMLADEQPFQDLLGDLYMRLNMGSDAIGQFFTPYHIAYLTAKTAMKKDLVMQAFNEKGSITIVEPAIGGGANLVAACNVLYDYGINYQDKCVVFVGQELSRLTAMMSYIMLSIIGANAVIKVGDTLKDPYTNFNTEVKKGSELWITPQFAKNNCFWVV